MKTNPAGVRRERDSGLALGIDLGGTKILAGVVDWRGRILGRGKLKTPFEAGVAVLTEALVAASDLALKEAGLTRERIRALAVAAPGPLDAQKGVLLRAGNLSVRNYAVSRHLEKAFPRARRRLENDLRLAALAEARLGAARGFPTVVAIWVGTGIGGAVIQDGHIRTGRNRNAGEIGHIQIDFRRARPGKPDGELEGIAAKVGMTRWLRQRIEKGERTVLKKAVLRKNGRLTGSDLVDALKQKDPLAEEAVARSARAVGIAIANVFNVLSPDRFVLGGGVAVDLGKPYLSEVQKWAKAFAFTTELGGVEVVSAALGDDAGLLGAALYARD